MKLKNTRGFTLIELMVALVVAGLLMGVLVGLSGAVQRSLGFSKEITELQANLRFALKTLVDDFSRVAYMTSPNPALDTASIPLKHLDRCPAPPPNLASIDCVSGAGDVTLRGNYISSRDYLMEMAPMLVVCRNQMRYDKNAGEGARCGLNEYEPNDEPFFDGPGKIEDAFCPGQVVRMEVELGQRKYCYYTIAAVDSASSGLQFTQPVIRDANAGTHLWFNPLTRVHYQLVQAPDLPVYPTGTDARFRWVLQRDFEGCNQGQLTLGQPVEVAEYLLPFDMGGFVLEQIIDESSWANLGGVEWQPDIGDDPGDVQPLACPVPLERIRAVVITLRGRLASEDPKFTIQGFTNVPPFLDYGVDLDGEPANGLARVRVERTVVPLRNIAL